MAPIATTNIGGQMENPVGVAEDGKLTVLSFIVNKGVKMSL